MRVLMVGWELPPHHSGGLGIACFQLCKSLCEQDVSIDFVLPYTDEHDIDFMNIHPATEFTATEFLSGMTAYSTEASQEVSSTTHKLAFGSIIDKTQAYAKVIEPIVTRQVFDVIHAHDWLTISAALRAKQISGKPLVLHIHATEYDRSAGNGGNEFVHEIEELGMSMADHVITVSQYTKNLVVEKYGIDPNKVSVVHNRIDPSMYQAVVDEGQSYAALAELKHHDYKIVSHVGRLTIQKGLWNLLHAFKLVVDHRPKTILLLAGNGEQMDELLELAADLGISQNIVFTEQFVNGARWRQAFTVSDLFVLTSVSEPFGLTPLEAALFGTPSLISNQCGVAEIFTNCLKVEYWDVHEIANQITSALESPALLEDLQTNCYQEADSLRWPEAAHKVKQVYGAAL